MYFLMGNAKEITMSNSSMMDRWNVVDTARMAVGVESVLSRTLRGKPNPYDFAESLESGIAFLDEALSGGRIICGDTFTGQFTGTLSPLNWSTDVYISFHNKRMTEEAYREIVSILDNYKYILEKIKIEAKNVLEEEKLKEAHNFFSKLAKMLLNQADPTNKLYSRDIS